MSQLIRFRSVQLSDREAIYAYGQDLKTVRYLTWGPHKQLSDADESCRLLQKDPWTWAVIYDEKMVGTISVQKINHNLQYFEIGYVLHYQFHRQKIMTQACCAIIKYMWTKFPKYFVLAFVFCENQPSQKLLKKLGFVSFGAVFWNYNHFVKKRLLIQSYLLSPNQPVWWMYQ